MSDEAPLIALRQVSYAPGGANVLSDIDFAASERRIGIVGRNGSGKTTLARVMAGLVAPDSGTVRIAGADVVADRKAALALVGILFQNPDHQIIFPTVAEELRFGLLQMRLPEEEVDARVADVLARFDRSHWAEATVHTMSQGQRQLVCLMAVLAMAPQVIILDEPFSGLDIPTALQLERRLAAIDCTVIQITHDPRMVADHDRVLWIENGRIEEDGPPASVLPVFEARMHEQGARDDRTDLAG
ncbi:MULTISPECIES: energy-coupling factor ABC transporter ATP-binding protein [unclassified Sulfitobacter]|uniref:energy-coupling factor ABC transporter ATP-binding protein n=1 Tax=unclassified Sulfitobacter TaxID=196795 RepID=UPI0007C22151|nr:MULTISPECIES: ABC transporter ATP-binding protein [unclassified Sulfitobacter]KZX94331.1 cobalt ABC transporter [Sulfitobacter sp. HI0023]KZY27262.1 cobalt ABC transporter [Sulfitobacter sp. HI0040]KZZ63701.1 cobalt ABC transporter [Sulfitobacter sp. HI0129]